MDRHSYEDRQCSIERLYQDLATLTRRSGELGNELRAGLSLAAYTLLTYVQGGSDTRAADVATAYGLDKSTVSRQVDQMVGAGVLQRAGERPGRRGQVLQVTAAGEEALARSSDLLHAYLVDRLSEWETADITTFAQLLGRFNTSTRS